MKKFLQMAKGTISLMVMISFIIAIIVPLPGFLIDVALVTSMALAITIFMKSLTIKEWDELKTFPTILLITAIFRIALNISTTRKILQDAAPGHVIEGAGNLIVGANIWVGFVIFIIMIVVQFIIANGTSRTSEVNARFTLDGMPMKQMSIDNELNNGSLSPEEAKLKRQKLEMEVDFYGNMDGAGKFIKGDVVAGVILFVVNIVFGIIIGVLVQKMPLTEAANRFTILSIGDGLVSQITSLLISISAGMVMTRVYSGDEKDVPGSIFTELTSNIHVTAVAGGVMALFGIVGWFTALPSIPFFLISILLIGISYVNYTNKMKEKALLDMKNIDDDELYEQEKVEIDTEVEPITLELGIALLPLVSEEVEGEKMQDKIQVMREVIAKELGVKIPQIHVVDNSSLMPYTKYRLKVKENVVAEGELRNNRLLALKTPYVVKEIAGEYTKDPIFGDDAVWISEMDANEAKDAGYAVYDPLSILGTHLNEIVRKHLYELLQRQEVQDLVDKVGKKHKVLKEEIDKKEISLSLIQGVLQNLLRETISIRDLPTILEAIIDGTPIVDANFDSEIHNRIDEVTAIVRERISKYICEKNKNQNGKMYVLLLNQKMEKEAKTIPHYGGYYLDLNMIEERNFLNALINEVQRAQMAEIEPVLLTGRIDLRFALARLVHKYNIPISVLSGNEIVSGIIVEQLGMVDTDYNEQAI